MSQRKGHPAGLYLLFMTEMAERFSYYGMRALFTLYMIAAFFTKEGASQIYGSYTGLVYLTPLLGGYIADRYWGNRRSIITGGLTMAVGQFFMFLSACFAKQSIFVEGGAIDGNVDNGLAITLMFVGLAALILGNGFFKPNISTMVGDLYEPTDKRKDSAFTIFYMGINVGAFIAPLICGTIGEGNWADLSPFKYGFLAACIAMLISVTIFVSLKDRYLHTPDGQGIGLKPVPVAKEVATGEEPARKANSPLRLWLCIAGLLVLLWLFGRGATDFNGYISAAIYAISIIMPIFIITDRSLTGTEKSRIGVIYIIAVFVIFFWSAFEQAGMTLTYFAEEQTNRTILGWEMPTSWFQSFNPIFVVSMAPVVAMVWEKLGKRGKEPASPVKQAIGLMLLAIGYLVITIGTRGASDGVKVSMFWLVALYFIHTIGELTLSPIGLSMVNKLAPKHLASLLMGVWFMSNAASNILAGKLATLYPEHDATTGVLMTKSIFGFEVATMSDFFTVFVVMAGCASVLLFCLCPLLKKMMRGID